MSLKNTDKGWIYNNKDWMILAFVLCNSEPNYEGFHMPMLVVNIGISWIVCRAIRVISRQIKKGRMERRYKDEQDYREYRLWKDKKAGFVKRYDDELFDGEGRRIDL